MSSTIGDSTADTLAINPILPQITTNTYSYTDSEWGDLLTAYNGVNITYDNIGNPLSYYNGSSYTFTWQGRRLMTAAKGTNTMSFTYNDEGIRVSKTVNGVTTNYYYQGSMLYAEETNSSITIYFYDQNGAPIGFQYRGADYANGAWDLYAYEKNIFGDIVAVYDESGTKLVSYTYNAWGECTVTNCTTVPTAVANNPYRYRGYYYDSDLGMYYLQSRYYDSEICRFISSDQPDVILATPVGLTDKNLYAYCDNNPVMRGDYDGEFWNYVIGAVVGAVVGGIVSALNGEDVSGIIIGAVSGAASGAVAASGLSIIAQATISAGISATADFTNQTIDIIQSNSSFDNYNLGQTVIETAFGFTTSFVGSTIGNLTGKHLTKTSVVANEAFDGYLEKTFSAGLRSAAGRSSSALSRQANKFLSQSIFWDNVTRGVSSVIGSVSVSAPSTPFKNWVNKYWP